VKEEQLAEILLELSRADGVSGAESGAVTAAARWFERFTDRIEQDRFGNLIACKKGTGAGGAGNISLALAAHIDEIGGMVTKIEAGGFLRFTSVGGIDPRTLLGQAVAVHGAERLTGVVGALAPHLLTETERKKELKLENLFIDVGLSEPAARAQVSIGDYITLDQLPVRLEAGKGLTGKALDNRAGVAALIFCAAELASRRHQADIYFVATLQEEVGLRGAITAAYGLTPVLAVAVDVTHGVAPGLSRPDAYELGDGTAIAVGPNIHPLIAARLRELAREHRVPCQIEPVAAGTGTDAWAFQVSREGIPTALLSVPLRYMHSAVELLNLEDLTSTGRLLGHFAAGLDRPFVEGLTCC
jgi:tetrahedral aminopeptidase